MRVLEIGIVVDASQAKRELREVDQAMDNVSSTGQNKLGAILDGVNGKWQALTKGLGGARQALNQVAEGAGITVGQLGLMNSALLAVGTAVTSYQLTRGFLDFVGLSE